MERKLRVVYEDKDFESSIIDGIGKIKIKENVFEIVTDLSESSRFFEALSQFENEPNIKALLISNEEDCLGNNAYENYLNTIFSHEDKDESWDHLELKNRATRTRQIVILNKLIKKIVNFPKLVVILLNGEIVTPFFGASLAADMRFAVENVTFTLAHIKMNIHPTGALPYFLPKYIGHAKAAKILFNKYKLTLEEAINLDLISKIFPNDNSEEMVIEEIKKRISHSNNAYACTKKLLSSNFNDLDKYLTFEECDFKQK